jgi:hypothetical protein
VRFIGARVPWLSMQGTHAEREAAAGASRACHGLWRGEEPGPNGLSRAGSGSAAGPGGDGSGLRARPVREGRVFFLNTFQCISNSRKNSENTLKHEK